MGPLELWGADDIRFKMLGGEGAAPLALQGMEGAPARSPAWAALDAAVAQTPALALGLLPYVVIAGQQASGEARGAHWARAAAWTLAAPELGHNFARPSFTAARVRAAQSLISDLLGRSAAGPGLVAELVAWAALKGAPVDGRLLKAGEPTVEARCPSCEAALVLMVDEDDLALVQRGEDPSVAIRTLVKPFDAGDRGPVDVDRDAVPVVLAALARSFDDPELADRVVLAFGRAACPVCFEAFDLRKALV